MPSLTRRPLTYPLVALASLILLPAAFRLGDRIGDIVHQPAWHPAAAPVGPVQVLTQRNDNRRSGNNLREGTLNTTTVTPGRFGKVFSREVDGDIYAQPLYVSGLELAAAGGGGGGAPTKRNVVFVATEHNSVYAFDADDPGARLPLWQTNLGRSVLTSEIGKAAYGTYKDFSEEIGITGSPVIDLPSHTLYVVAKTIDTGGTIRQHLHALDIRTGKPRQAATEIVASVPGRGVGGDSNRVPFNSRTSNQRSSLLLDRGVLYLAWASHADIQPYHGWVMAYDASTLRQIDAWCSTPDGEGGGVWMSGTGISADSEGNLYFVVGDGTYTGERGGRDWGDSFLKMRLQDGKLKVTDYFTPHDQARLNELDKDLGSCGAVLATGANFIVSGSKAGVLYQIDPTRMGGFRSDSDAQILNRFPVTRGNIYGTPLTWDDPEFGPTVFVWGGYDYLKAFRLDREGRIDPQPKYSSTMPVPAGKPGGFLSFSSNGGEDGTAIVWASHPLKGSANRTSVPGVLRAFDARDISRELWNSEIDAERDSVGLFGKFCMPTVANGKVYLGTFSKRLNVYGLLPAASVGDSSADAAAATAPAVRGG